MLATTQSRIRNKSILILVGLLCIANSISSQIPHLQKKGKASQLIVNDQPFIILGGELGNSSASTLEYMQTIWPKLKAMHLNTVLVPVYWELIEKQEGEFDFSLIEELILEARTNNIKIIFLWFASWKNSMSSHAPKWVKLNQEKYPRANDDKGRGQEILSPFSENNLMADQNAFVKLMEFTKAIDKDQQTVIMVQVENEIGMLPVARDYSILASAAFQKDVPKELINYLKQNKANLIPEFYKIWEANGFKTKGNWEEIFGKGSHTDEIFMAWFFSKFTNKIAAAGKMAYPIPMFVNAALPRPNAQPGINYPSAGPLPHLMDVWKAAGTAIDFLSPDFYNPDFKKWNDLYVRQGDPLFIPEHRFDSTVAAKAIFAIGHYGALGFSPFSIESKKHSKKEDLGKAYDLIQQLSPLISANLGSQKMEAYLFDKVQKEIVDTFGNYIFTFRHELTLGWSPGSTDEVWPLTAAILIQSSDSEFYVAGTGFVVSFKTLDNANTHAGILKIDEGKFVNGEWSVLRHFNGDQTHQGRHLRIPIGEYGIQRLELYSYK